MTMQPMTTRPRAGQRRRVFLTGATGAMGLAVAGSLVQAGHEVLGVSRSTEGADALRALGAQPVNVDLFDEPALRDAMRGSDVVAHFATKIPEGFSMVKPGAWRMNDRLRTEGTRNLIAAAEANDVGRFIFESIALAYPDRGDEWIDETVPLQPLAPFMHTALHAEEMVEAFGQRGREAVSLRFPRLYGPDRASAAFLASVQKRQMPVVGPGENFVSSIHADDVGTAVVAALDVEPGAYNVADSEPVRQQQYLVLAAAALGAPAPRRVPYPVARAMMRKVARLAAVSHRVSSRRFREATGWEPRFASVAEGWPDVVQRHQQAAVAA